MKTTAMFMALACYVLCNNLTLAQNNAQSDLSLNRSALRYYNGQELQLFASEAGDKYQVLLYYFTNSFTVTRNKCVTCEVDFNDFFNQDLFNIVEFEAMRQQSTEVTFVFKNKYKVTLKSLDEVVSNTAGYQISEMINMMAPRPLPVWVATGNDAQDYEEYKRLLQVWVRDFPEEYRSLTSGNTVKKIEISEFLGLPIARRNALVSVPGAYIIVD